MAVSVEFLRSTRRGDATCHPQRGGRGRRAHVARSVIHARFANLAALSLAACLLGGAPWARADDVSAWLARAANAARAQNYVGTIVYQHGGHVETSRLAHIYDNGEEFDRLVSLDGPAREVIRSAGEVRCYYPDAKLVRVEPRTIRNVFPSLSSEQQQALAQYYDFRKAESARIAGYDAQAWVFEPKDGLRYGHKFWAENSTGLLLKARVLGEGGAIVEQFAFMDITIGGSVDPALVKPTWASTPPDWTLREGSSGETMARDTGWVVTRLPPGFVKIMEGFRRLRGKPDLVAHLVFSDGLVAVSVFVQPVTSAPTHVGFSQQGGVNVFSVRQDDNLVTALGEVPPSTVRQIASSVTHH
ncbi:MAG: MucB/RseB C-terminal domain-containing protein [Casimicrobiaceae bacterium]